MFKSLYCYLVCDIGVVVSASDLSSLWYELVSEL